MMETTYKKQRLFRWLFALTTLYLGIMPLYNNALNLMFRLPSLFVIVLIIKKTYGHIRYKYGLPIFIIIFLIFSHFVIDTRLTFDMFLSCFSVLCLLLLVISSSEIIIDEKTNRFIYRFSLLSALFLLAYFLSPRSHSAVIDGYLIEVPYLTFGLNNSNFAGITAFTIYSMIYITMNTRKRMTTILNIVVLLILLYFIVETNCRSAIGSAVLIPILDFFYRRKKINKKLLLLLCYTPFVFVPLYLYLYKIGYIVDTEVLGKNILSGRQNTFDEYLAYLSNFLYWVFGNLNDSKLQNAHNGPLSIVSSIGIIGCISFFYILIHKLSKSIDFANNNTAIVAVFVIIACFVNSSVESALFLGGFPVITHLFAFYIFAHYRIS